ncbi:polysaccharide deacetylase family protein [Microvirga tunisiensis]|uniref:Chitooligosaccharide deacetylase n=2 Tax=Pannonibacter tanglangensis TaxID=2750084 RepID=A0A7X5F3L5_9HYPH|nr:MULTISPECIES: polysaccharide deacetylase family protein [unclassified Pannonibacter]NBN62505.1 polysaccharide deacetylase family protein [Pannonibacter sp. XCT-34]NBN78160.1 polysaccharide deacetylase family protein [Pannonibacter sp. XCT-53]
MDFRRRFFSASFWVLRNTWLPRLMAPLTRGCGIIFTLHSVRPKSDDPFQPNAHLEITPEFLGQVVDVLGRHGYRIVSLTEAIDRLALGYGNERFAVLTFDDGYRDNLEQAYPVLKALGVPMTLFITSGLIDRTSELWWVALERLIRERDRLTASVQGGLTELPCGTPEEKATCFSVLRDVLIRETDEREQRALVRKLAAGNGLDLAALAGELMMSWDDLRALSRDRHVTIGAHTHDHFALARLSEAEARADVERGMTRIEAELGLRPQVFAYPYGDLDAAGAREARLIAELGFQAAVTTRPGVLTSAHARDLMHLPRVSLNGHFQDPVYVEEYLTGAPFVLFRAASGLSRAVSRRAASTR